MTRYEEPIFASPSSLRYLQTSLVTSTESNNHANCNTVNLQFMDWKIGRKSIFESHGLKVESNDDILESLIGENYHFNYLKNSKFK